MKDEGCPQGQVSVGTHCVGALTVRSHATSPTWQADAFANQEAPLSLDVQSFGGDFTIGMTDWIIGHVIESISSDPLSSLEDRRLKVPILRSLAWSFWWLALIPKLSPSATSLAPQRHPYWKILRVFEALWQRPDIFLITLYWQIPYTAKIQKIIYLY